jgi:LacI family transcriptional regulator
LKTITIKDVAQRAGVSPKTVSRVINGEAHVRPEIREAVARVVADMNYQPNAFARGLSSSRSFLIGLFFDDPASGYAASIQRGALERARALGRHLVIEPITFDRSNWRDLLSETLQGLRLAGAILTSPICDRPELIEVFERHDVPIVRIAPGADFERTPQVRMDDRHAARAMTEHLLSLGHRDIGFVLGNPRHSATDRRYSGFCDAISAAGLVVDPQRVVQGDFRFVSGLDAADFFFSREPYPTAVFASNDEMALGVLVAAMSKQIVVPRTVSVVGFDDAEIARMALPQLTTIRQPNFEMGAAAVDLLMEQARAGGEPMLSACRELPYELVVRGSSMPRALF